jgi:hypothetical protein
VVGRFEYRSTFSLPNRKVDCRTRSFEPTPRSSLRFRAERRW